MKRRLILVLSLACLTAPACALAQSEDAPSEDTTPPYARHDEIERERNSQIGAARAQQKRLHSLQREMSQRQKAEKGATGETDAPPVAEPEQKPKKPKTATAKPRCVGACP
jgi:hypothetical protein